jgi:tRNA(adenine34) deaminase
MIKQQAPTDDFLMDQALRLAQKGLDKGEVPVGALIVDENGTIMAQAYNAAERRGCQLGHAETLAIAKACKKRGNWRLNGCSIYVTLEPCLMCYGLIRLSRIEKLIYATPSTLFGYSREVITPDNYPGNIAITSGLKQDASLAMLRKFFGQARMREKGGNNMKKKIDCAAVRTRLLERRLELQKSTLSRSDFSEEAGEVKDIADEAYLLSSQKLQRTLGETDYSEIKLIDEAVSRLDAGGYGICVDCSGEISEARLDYYPYAVRCIVCQEAKTS